VGAAFPLAIRHLSRKPWHVYCRAFGMRKLPSGNRSVADIATRCIARALEQRTRYEVLRAQTTAVLDHADRSIRFSNQRLAAAHGLLDRREIIDEGTAGS
jgi:hypothetical protein